MSEYTAWADAPFGTHGLPVHPDCPACVAAGELLVEATRARDASAAVDARIHLREHPDHRAGHGRKAAK
ncbi:hypothetical protein ACGH2B_12740 [Streptomyces sp. BBFR2]|uniref:hypothetical protein n=1 Tax=Streptomyces sp. BBFR2 TaxID=3372854 RepID=UPI0037DA1C6C